MAYTHAVHTFGNLVMLKCIPLCLRSHLPGVLRAQGWWYWEQGSWSTSAWTRAEWVKGPRDQQEAEPSTDIFGKTRTGFFLIWSGTGN